MTLNVNLLKTNSLKQDVLHVGKDKFYSMPIWKQKQLKKQADLY